MIALSQGDKQKKQQENKSVPEGGGGVILLVSDLRSAVQCLQECLRVRDLKRFWSFAASFPPTAVCNDNNNDNVNNSGREKEEVFPGTLFTGLRRGCSSRVGAGRSGVQSAASR